MVDPFTYRERLLKPKMLINGANDRYWTLNALDLYWNDLQGPKYLVELPNAGHDLKVNRDWATSGLGAFFHHVVLNRPMPQLTWDFAEGPARRLPCHDSRQPRATVSPRLDGPLRQPRLSRVEVGICAAQTGRDDDLPGPTRRLGPRRPVR